MQRISSTHHPVSSGATFLGVLAVLAGAASAQAQHASTGTAVTSTTTLAAQLQQVLPADVAARILARVAAADSVGLPGKTLEQRALKFAARGVAAAAIEQSVDAQAGRMAHAKQALEHAHTHHATGDEIEAGAEAMRQGVSGSMVSALAKSAPSGRSLAVSLYVIGNLTARGLPADQALVRVEARLNAHASDEDVESLLSTVAQGRGDHGGDHGGDHPGGVGGGVGAGVGVGAGASVGAGAGGPPTGVPANGGTTVRPPKVTLPIGTHTH